MATCKDCIHYDLCADFNLTARADYKRSMQIVEDNGKPERCGFFKDRCHLVEIPTPHGRLIDADVACEKYKDEDSLIAELAYRKIRNAPTVIEAEED